MEGVSYSPEKGTLLKNGEDTRLLDDRLSVHLRHIYTDSEFQHFLDWVDGRLKDAFAHTQKEFPQLKSIEIAGSFGDGRPTVYSDIDIVLVLENPYLADKVKPVFRENFFPERNIYPSFRIDFVAWALFLSYDGVNFIDAGGKRFDSLVDYCISSLRSSSQVASGDTYSFNLAPGAKSIGHLSLMKFSASPVEGEKTGMFPYRNRPFIRINYPPYGWAKWFTQNNKGLFVLREDFYTDDEEWRKKVYITALHITPKGEKEVGFGRFMISSNQAFAGEDNSTDLSVDPSYRGSGLGRVLLAAGVSSARDNGCYLFTSKNPSIPPFQQVGFEVFPNKAMFYIKERSRDLEILVQYAEPVGLDKSAASPLVEDDSYSLKELINLALKGNKEAIGSLLSGKFVDCKAERPIDFRSWLEWMVRMEHTGTLLRILDMTKEQQKEIEPLMNEIASIYHDNPFLKERILQKYDVLTKNIAEIKESGGGISLQLKEEFQVLTDAIQAFYITDIDKLKEILRLLKREKHILSSSPVDVTDEIKLRQGVLSGLTSSVAGGEPYPGAALFIFSRVPKRDNPNLAASPVGFSFESRVVSPESSLPLINSRPMTHILRLPGASSPVENRALEVDTAANGRLMVEACFNQPVKGMVRLAFFDVQKQAIGYADILLDCYLFNYLYVNSKFRSKGFSELMMAVKFKLIEDGWVSKGLDFTMFHSYARNPLTARSLMQFGYEPQAFSTAYNFSTTLVIGERTADNKRGIYIADPVKRENFKHYVADNPQDYGIFYLVDRSIDGVHARIYANYYLTDKEKYQKRLAHFGIKHITEIKGSHIVGNSAASSPDTNLCSVDLYKVLFSTAQPQAVLSSSVVTSQLKVFGRSSRIIREKGTGTFFPLNAVGFSSSPAEIYSVQEFILPDGEIIKRDVSRIYLDLKRYLQAAKREVAQMIRAHDWRVWNKCSSEEDIPDSASIGRKLSLLNQAMENTYLIGGIVR
ncbi:MAG: GNAT family N-acetyltransferase [Candidatus Aminicenantes bacterium]|nr:GNAT family N-acetyltransferase [Candidatus Aminicenantes bacterium]